MPIPHQNLDSLTPAEHWAGLRRPARFKREYWFEAWEGPLQGYYFTCSVERCRRPRCRSHARAGSGTPIGS